MFGSERLFAFAKALRFCSVAGRRSNLPIHLSVGDYMQLSWFHTPAGFAPDFQRAQDIFSARICDFL